MRVYSVLRCVRVQWNDGAVGPMIVVHGTTVQSGYGTLMRPRSSSISGSRQSHLPAKHGVATPAGVMPPSSSCRNSVNAVPFGVRPSMALLQV